MVHGYIVKAEQPLIGWHGNEQRPAWFEKRAKPVHCPKVVLNPAKNVEALNIVVALVQWERHRFCIKIAQAPTMAKREYSGLADFYGIHFTVGGKCCNVEARSGSDVEQVLARPANF